MSSWVLQLVLLAACLRFGCFEGDPLPAALVEMVRNSPITSIQDLQLLLLSDSVEEDPDSQPAVGLHSNNTFSRSPRSLEAEPAQQALCKVRTEVLEVTRTMLDRRNANFMLWPPCVEVQRCSGCCNARTLQCVPVITQTRYLQVMKIQYVSRRPHYDKAVISVQDHVECRCQSAPVPKGARTAPKKLHPRRQGPKEPPSRTRSKEELHRRDELKWNQNFHLDERQPRYPPEHALAPRGDNALPGRARALEAQTGRPPLQVPLGALNLTGQWEEEEEERALLTGLGLRRPPQGAGQSGLRENGRNATEESWADGRRPAWLNVTENATQGGRRGPARDRAVAVDTWDPEAQTPSAALQSLTETRPPTGGADETAQVRHGGRPAERGEERGLLRQEQLTLEEEKGALLLLQQKLDQENRQIQILQRQQHHHHDHRQQRLHHQTQTHTTTQTAVTAPLPTTTRPPPPTRPPPIPVTARTPARKAPPKRRMRKNRNRISKAAMRAMLM
ncbi:uncharacterized protein pdgfbb isoform X3 [Anguilla rostrata]|uniref:uncharacterized protein pdgfbb isoform X3 n=1 Tax=Anguilla rostrata TaxID=7938 RepID=UPI0030D2DD58